MKQLQLVIGQHHQLQLVIGITKDIQKNTILLVYKLLILIESMISYNLNLQ